jgi:hypothetical protein
MFVSNFMNVCKYYTRLERLAGENPQLITYSVSDEEKKVYCIHQLLDNISDFKKISNSFINFSIVPDYHQSSWVGIDKTFVLD